MDGGIVGGIVTVAVAVTGGPHLWRWLTERRRLLHALDAAERLRVEEASARVLAALEARVRHLEEERAHLVVENRTLHIEVLEKTREVERLNLAHAALVVRVARLETTLETINAVNARAIERAIAAAIAQRDTQT